MPKAPLAHEPSQPLLAFAQGHVPEVLAFELQEVECIQRGRCDDAAAVQRDGAALKEPLASEPWLPLNRSNVSLRQVRTIRWSRHSARQNTFSLTRPPDARPHRGSILSLWSTSLGRSSDFAAGQGVGPEWRR
jgi:hypothetical protein